MANIKSQKKRIKTNEKARLRNKVQKSATRTEMKKLDLMITEGNKEEAVKLLSVVYKKIDSSVSKGTMTKNKAARQKSRFTKKVNQM